MLPSVRPAAPLALMVAVPAALGPYNAWEAPRVNVLDRAETSKVAPPATVIVPEPTVPVPLRASVPALMVVGPV